MSNVKTTITFVNGDAWCENKRCPYYQYYDGIMGLCGNEKDECTYKQTEEYKQEMKEEEEGTKENEKFINFMNKNTQKQSKKSTIWYPRFIQGEWEPVEYIDADSFDNKEWVKNNIFDCMDLCEELNNKKVKES